MNESEDEVVESVWTNSNLLKLLTSLKGTIPEGEETTNYQKGMKSVDWNKVAFPPFSPEECRQKWTNMMEKMRKLRSLPELIAEAENVISDPLNNRKIHPEVPKRPLGPRTRYFMEHYHKFKKKHPNMKQQKIFKLLYKKFEKLPEEKRVVYKMKYAGEILEYQKKMQEFSKHNKICVKVKMAAPYRRYKEELQDRDLPTKPPQTSKVDALELSRGWRNLSLKEKAAYKKRWIELKRQYASKLHTYLDSFSKEEQKQIIKEKGITVPKNSPRTKGEMSQPGEPKMPSRVPYSYFFGEQLKLLKDKIPNIRERRLETQELWKNVSIKEKERYKSKVHEAIRRYSAELQKWFMTLEPEQQAQYLKDNPSKSQYLSVNKMANCDQTKMQFGQTSDSEDEVIVNISDEEDMSGGYEEEEEKEEEEDIIMFEIN